MNARLFLAALFLAGKAAAAPVMLGSTSIEIPAPEGYAEVTPQMTAIWPVVEAAQGDNHVLAMFIPESEKKDALAGKVVNLDRNINIQTRRRLEAPTFTPEFFGQVKTQVREMLRSRQASAIQAKELERFNGNLSKAAKIDLQLAEKENVALPPHVDGADRFAWSELSVMEGKMPDGSTQRQRVTQTATMTIVRGKIVSFYVTGDENDLEWSRTMAAKWIDAVFAANRR